mmetsp:Transcript_1500/g.2394  ORF Transcript_1500/g.2394 Transcript_1500/m.2394 type:complete len:203 (-) Transcript_1500:1458-2066(-)
MVLFTIIGMMRILDGVFLTLLIAPLTHLTPGASRSTSTLGVAIGPSPILTLRVITTLPLLLLFLGLLEVLAELSKKCVKFLHKCRSIRRDTLPRILLPPLILDSKRHGIQQHLTHLHLAERSITAGNMRKCSCKAGIRIIINAGKQIHETAHLLNLLVHGLDLNPLRNSNVLPHVPPLGFSVSVFRKLHMNVLPPTVPKALK